MNILAAFLKLFSHFKNPKALFKEKKLYETYLELLSHRENEIQLLAYYCLKTYKFAYLKPYEEHFEKLFQDNTFRDELTLFAAGEENELIKAEHRIEVMKILIRLVNIVKRLPITLGNLHFFIRIEIMSNFKFYRGY